MINKKPKFYSLKNIRSKNAHYNVIFGERSNGKTFSVLELGLEEYVKDGTQIGIVRRWDEDFRGKRANQLYDTLITEKENKIKKITKGEWDQVVYYSGRWFLAKFDEDLNKTVKSEDPIAFAFALTGMEHDKSTSYPRIKIILFDEFLTRKRYLPDEFVTFMNVVSTIVRHRNNVTIYMLGNTVNKYSPYFSEMGLKHVPRMKQGDIDVYSYGESKLKVAVEYSDSPSKKGKESDTYFAFDNPKLHMITGGVWEMAIYPHCPCKFTSRDIVYIYFIQFESDLLQCEIVQHEDLFFTYIHRKTTPLQDDTKDLIFNPNHSPRPNHRRKITKPINTLEKKIAEFFVKDKVFYQDNEIGEVVRNYLNWCKTAKVE